jgi:hypothetical protein
MQEKCLSARTLHFIRGGMVWECAEGSYGQGEFIEPLPFSDLRTPLKTFQRAFDGPYECHWSDDEEDDDEEEDHGDEDAAEEHEKEDNGEKPRNTSRGTMIDFRDPLRRDEVPPTLVTSYHDPLWHFLSMANTMTIYYVWYSVVSVYSGRQLTFSFDKLPALAGIASRVHDITKDDYLAGHWRRELERSLFWHLDTEADTAHPGRCKEYRAPSWSWASVNASTVFDFADLTPGKDLATTLEVVEAEVHVDGKNPFGRVASGSIRMKVHVLRASWHKDSASWRIDSPACTHGDTQFDDLKFTTADNTVIGVWHYDDVINGIMPGAQLEEHTPLEEVYTRTVPHGYFGSIAASNIRIHGPDANDSSTLWKRGTYVPEDLLLVQGPTRKLDESEQQEHGGRTTSTDVLVLASTENSKYRRVGIGKLGIWDSTIETVEVLTVV